MCFGSFFRTLAVNSVSDFFWQGRGLNIDQGPVLWSGHLNIPITACQLASTNFKQDLIPLPTFLFHHRLYSLQHSQDSDFSGNDEAMNQDEGGVKMRADYHWIGWWSRYWPRVYSKKRPSFSGAVTSKNKGLTNCMTKSGPEPVQVSQMEVATVSNRQSQS